MPTGKINIIIAGLGAVGGYFGTFLALNKNNNVCFLSRGDTFKYFNSNRLILKSYKGYELSFKPKVSDNAATFKKKFDYVFVCTKSKDTASLIPQIKKVLSKKPYFIFVAHRQENIYNLPRLTTFLDDMFLLAEKTHCVFILHEPTKVALEKHKMLDKIKEHKNITILPRQSYFDFMKLIDNSEFFITDGGSNQEEAYYFGKPCLILRNHTERIEGLGENVILWKDGENSIVDFGSNYKKFEREPAKYQKAPSKIIYEEILNA